MPVKQIILILSLSSLCFSSVTANSYSTIADELMIQPASASMAGSDLSTGSGVSVESTPGNLPFDSLNHLSLSYAGFYGNSFSTSIISFNGKPTPDIGISLLAGYVYVPGILNTTESNATDSGDLRDAKITSFSASRIILRAGVGRLFTVTPNILIGAGVALNGKRVRLPELGYGIGMDAGIKAHFTNYGISLAMQLENVTSSYTYWNKSYQERAYQHLRAGIGYEKNIPYLYGAVKWSYATPDLFANEGINSVTYESSENDNIVETPGHDELYKKPALLLSHGRYGLEYTVMNTVSFRGGIANNNVTFGAGLYLLNNKASIDFAYIIHALAGTYQLSVNYQW